MAQAVWNGVEFLPRDLMTVTMALDHRLIDGAEAAEFVQALKDLIEATGSSDDF